MFLSQGFIFINCNHFKNVLTRWNSVSRFSIDYPFLHDFSFSLKKGEVQKVALCFFIMLSHLQLLKYLLSIIF